jgi:hypothetical protein
MKKIASGLFLAALLASGCMLPDAWLMVEPQHATPPLKEAKTPAHPAPPVTADQVNEKNAGEMSQRLADELKREESSERTKCNEIVDKPKLAIP